MYSVAYLGFGKGVEAWRARWARAYDGALGGRSPPEAETLCFWTFNGSRKFAHFLWNSETQKITASYQMQSHIAILIAYCIGMKKRPSNIVEFCNSCWKTAKNRTFSYKVALKNFHGRAKGGGPSHRGPPPKYATECTLLLPYCTALLSNSIWLFCCCAIL